MPNTLTCLCAQAAPSLDNASPLPLSATMSSITEQPGGSGTDTQLLDGGFSPWNHLFYFNIGSFAKRFHFQARDE